MSRRVFQLVAGLVLIFATLTPLANCFDTWDKGQPPANDTEFQVTMLLIGAGLVLVLPKLVPRLLIPAVRFQQTLGQCLAGIVLCSGQDIPEPSASPPPLIPLRI